MNTFKVSQSQVDANIADMATYAGSRKSQGTISTLMLSLGEEPGARALAFLASKSGVSPLGVVEAVCIMLTSVAKTRYRVTKVGSERKNEAARFICAVVADEDSSFDAAWECLISGLGIGSVGVQRDAAQALLVRFAQ